MNKKVIFYLLPYKTSLYPLPGLCGTPVPVSSPELSMVPSLSHTWYGSHQIPGLVLIHWTTAVKSCSLFHLREQLKTPGTLLNVETEYGPVPVSLVAPIQSQQRDSRYIVPGPQ